MGKQISYKLAKAKFQLEKARLRIEEKPANYDFIYQFNLCLGVAINEPELLLASE